MNTVKRISRDLRFARSEISQEKFEEWNLFCLFKFDHTTGVSRVQKIFPKTLERKGKRQRPHDPWHCRYVPLCPFVRNAGDRKDSPILVEFYPRRYKTSSVGQRAGLSILRSSVRFREKLKFEKSITQFYMNSSHVDPEAGVLNYCFKGQKQSSFKTKQPTRKNVTAPGRDKYTTEVKKKMKKTLKSNINEWAPESILNKDVLL